MPECLLRFSRINAGRDARGCVHIYYGRHYVGAIGCSGGVWSARLHDVPLGRFDELEAALRVVAEWYYGPAVRCTVLAVHPAETPDAARCHDQK